jgi:hypothetical protein
MTEHHNVIDGRSRFQRQGGTSGGGASFEDRLGRTARVPLDDRPTMAANLGRLAERINPASPLAGAKRIVDETGHEGLWQKRKRFIRLPSEDASPIDETGAYGSSGSTYLSLARSAGKILASNQTPDAVERERERAVRTMLVGTSFLPSYTPLTKSDRTAKSLLDEYESVLLGAVKTRTRLVDLWTVLEDSPLDLEARAADEEPFELTFGGTEKFPETLLRPIFRDHIVEAIFQPKDGIGFGWDEPTVELGFVAIQVVTSMFAIPEDAAELFHASNENEDGYLAEEAVEWLRSIGYRKGSFLPDDPFDRTVGYGWKPATFSVLRRVGLTIAKNDEGQPKLKLHCWGDDAVAYNSYGLNGHQEDMIVESGGQTSQLRSLDCDTDDDLYDCLYAVYSEPLRYDVFGGEARVVGLLPTWNISSEFYRFSDCGWSDDPTSASLLIGGEHRFIPTIENCEPVAGPLRSGSLGAGILNNAISAQDANSVANLLIEKAALTADAALRFHEAMVDRYRDALRRI